MKSSSPKTKLLFGFAFTVLLASVIYIAANSLKPLFAKYTLLRPILIVTTHPLKPLPPQELSYTHVIKATNTPDIRKPTEIITLDKRNTVVFREIVSSKSVSLLMQKLMKLSNALKKSDVIYLVLDTPGGKVTAGNRLIDFAKSLPQKVQTLSLFAASMGFHIAQNLDTRMVLPSSTLMSHRIQIAGLGGQVPGEAVKRLERILRLAEIMDKRVAKRMRLTLRDYKKLIRDELWIAGHDAVVERAADKLVLARCAANLSDTYSQDINILFIKGKVYYSSCPLIPSPIKLDIEKITLSNRDRRAQILEFVYDLYYDRKKFTKKYIITNTYKTFIK